MSERVELEYRVKVTGLDEARVAAESASASASKAATSLNAAKSHGENSLPTMLMTIRAVNATRLAVTQTSRAITELNPTAAMYGFLNMIQVVRNLTGLTRMLNDATGSAAAAQAVLASLTGRMWLIPAALAAGALVYSQVRSMQTARARARALQFFDIGGIR